MVVAVVGTDARPAGPRPPGAGAGRGRRRGAPVQRRAPPGARSPLTVEGSPHEHPAQHVVTVGADLLADAVEGQAVAGRPGSTGARRWRAPRTTWPPSPPTRAAGRPTTGRSPPCSASPATLVDVAPASEVLGLEPGEFLHAGPPIGWDRAVRPAARRADGRRGARGAGRRPRGRRRALRGRRVGSASSPATTAATVGPMAGVVTPSMWMFVLEDPATGPAHLLLAQRGARQGAAVRRLRPRGARAAALDVAPCSGRCCATAVRATSGPVDVTGILTQMLQMGDEAHNRNRAGTLMLLRDLAPAMATSGADAADVAESLRFIGGNDHFFLNLAMPACKLALDAARDIDGLDDGRRDGPQRHRLRHPGLRHRRRVVHRARRSSPTACSSATTGPTTPTPTSATPRSPRRPASAASRWRPPRRSCGSSAARCPTPSRPRGGCTRSRSARTPAGSVPVLDFQGDADRHRRHPRLPDRHPPADQHRDGRQAGRRRPGRRRAGHPAGGDLPRGPGRPRGARAALTSYARRWARMGACPSTRSSPRPSSR